MSLRGLSRQATHVVNQHNRLAAALQPSKAQRYLTTAVPNFGVDEKEYVKSQRVAVEERHDITTLDKLLKVVRSRSDPKYRSSLQMRMRVPWSDVLLDSRSPAPELREPVNHEAPSTDPIPARRMYDSYSQIDLPFASSPELLDHYTNAWGGIRTGKLMEHLDSLAGSIAYKHVLGPNVQTVGKIHETGFYIVTASIDRLDMLADLYPVRDIRLSGHVIYVGKSSMEIAVKMEAIHNGQEQTLMLGRFSMVCRDAHTHKARQVNPLIVSTPEEESLVKMGEMFKKRRLQQTERSLSRVPPTSEEAAALHHLYLSHRTSLTGGSHSEDQSTEKVWLSDTKLEKTLLMFPQERNIHQKIFGGYLMRLAYELGFTNVTLFTRNRMRFLSLDGISFRRPVPIGSILRLTSHITHSASHGEFPSLAHVGVKADVLDWQKGATQTSNTFKFTWCSQEPLNRVVVPNTYAESMLWLSGRRALHLGAEIRQNLGKS